MIMKENGKCRKKIEPKNTPKSVLCPYAAKCGGCFGPYLAQAYEQSLKDKYRQVQKLLSKYGPIEPIIGATNPYHYRNKVHAVVSQNRKGEYLIGTYEADSHRVVDVATCLLDEQEADAIILTIKRLLPSFRYAAYDEDRRTGLIRHIQIRKAMVTGEIMVTLVVTDLRIPSKANFVKALIKEHPEITTIVANLNTKKTSMVLGEKEEILYGRGYIEDELCGKRFAISSRSFYQINHAQCELLYRKAYEYAGLTGTEDIMDAYSGIGTIGIGAANQARSVTGVELNEDAVRDAKTNVKRNQLTSCQYYAMDAGSFMLREATRGHHYDVVFMDPPRTGSSKDFLQAIVKSVPKKVVYISCNPVTQARDLEYLNAHGYRMERCTPVDLFPWTRHVETVVLLSKKHINHHDYVEIGVDAKEYYKIKGDK